MASGLFIVFGVFVVLFVIMLVGYAGWLFARRGRLRAEGELRARRNWQAATAELDDGATRVGTVIPPGPRAIGSTVIVEDRPDVLGGMVNALIAEQFIEALSPDTSSSTPTADAFTAPDPAPSIDPGTGFDGGSTGFDPSPSVDSGSGFGGDGGSF